MKRVYVVVVVVLGAVAGLAASVDRAEASPARLISWASDSGKGSLGSGFDTGVGRPTKLILKVKVRPNVRIDLEYQVFCKGHGESGGTNVKRRTRSRRLRLPLKVEDPRSCLVYAFGSYSGKAEHSVRFRIELRARQRGRQAQPPEPLEPHEIHARLKVEPTVVPVDGQIAFRAIGRHAHKLLTGVDLRLDRPDGAGGWEPAFLLFSPLHEGEPLPDPVALPSREPILIPLIGYAATAERVASLRGVPAGEYRLRMDATPQGGRRLPDNIRLYRQLRVPEPASTEPATP